MKKKKFRSSTNITEIQKLSLPEQDLESPECDSFVKCISRCYHLFSFESKFIAKLLNNNKKAITRILSKIIFRNLQIISSKYQIRELQNSLYLYLIFYLT